MTTPFPCPRCGAEPASGELRCPRCGYRLDRPAPRQRTSRLAFSLALLLLVSLGLPFLMRGLVFTLRHPQLSWQQSFDSDRLTNGQNGMPRLSGPDSPGGPTYGESPRADLEVADFGWNFLGPDSNPHEHTWAFAAIHNKSRRTWQAVAVQLRLMDRQGNTFAHTAIPIGDLAPGETRKAQFPVSDPRVSYSGITGIRGR